jgi:hypothetical protein
MQRFFKTGGIIYRICTLYSFKTISRQRSRQSRLSEPAPFPAPLPTGEEKVKRGVLTSSCVQTELSCPQGCFAKNSFSEHGRRGISNAQAYARKCAVDLPFLRQRTITRGRVFLRHCLCMWWRTGTDVYTPPNPQVIHSCDET